MRAGPGGPSVTVVTDPRIAPVEDNLDAFLETLVSSGAFDAGSDPDVWSYWCDVAFPLFNGIGRARFAPGEVQARAREVVASYVERGLPFMWWATPSGHAEELTPLLVELGMTCEPVPGMYTELRSEVEDRTPPDATLREVTGHEMIPVMVAGFGMPEELIPHLDRFVAGLDPHRVVNLVATLDGRDVGCGTMLQTGDTAGLYNIATVEQARGRGIGYAVTAALMNAGRERGATRSVLHASEQGRALYERLGFETVCQVPQFVWMPPDVEAPADPPADPPVEPETTVI